MVLVSLMVLTVRWRCKCIKIREENSTVLFLPGSPPLLSQRNENRVAKGGVII